MSRIESSQGHARSTWPIAASIFLGGVLVAGTVLVLGAGQGSAPSLVGPAPGAGSGIEEGALTDDWIDESTDVVVIDDRSSPRLPEPGPAPSTPVDEDIPTIDADDPAGPNEPDTGRDENNIDPNESRPGLAVIPFKVNSTDEEDASAGDALARWLLAEIDTDNYRLYERSQLNAILREKQFHEHGRFSADPEAAMRLGRLAGIRYLVIGELDQVGGEYGLTARRLDCLNGELGDRGTVYFKRLREARTHLPELVNLLALRVGGSGRPPVDDGAPEDEYDLVTGRELIDAENPEATFHVSVATSDGRDGYVEGERLNFVFSADRSCYLTVLTMNEQGDVVQLLPNRRRPRVFVNAGDRITVPPTDEGYFPVTAPHGESLVKVIGTLQPLRLASLEHRGRGTYESIGSVGDERMQQAGREFVRQKSIGEERSIREGTDEPSAGLGPGTWTTASLRVMTGSDRYDLERRLAERDGRPWPPPAEPEPEPAPRPAPPDEREELVQGDPNDAILDEWNTLQGASAKNVGGPVRMPAKSIDPDDQGVTELLVFYGEDAGPANAKGLRSDPLLGRFQVVPASTTGAKAIGSPDLEERIRQLEQQPGVIAVLPNLEFSALAPPTTRLLQVQWALRNQYRPGIDTAWHVVCEEIAGIQPALMGVCDMGIHHDDPRLRDSCWTNAGEIEGNGVDDDGNGFVDDVHGFNFVNGSAQLYASGQSFNHGTWCSSIIAARPLGRPDDLVGVAPAASIVTAVVLDDEGKGKSDVILRGIAYAAARGAKVINLSLGGQVPAEFIERANRLPLWDELERQGVILVVAAGNDHIDIDAKPFFPACLPRSNVITVLATDAAGRPGRILESESASGDRSWQTFTNHGAMSVDIGAPGSLITGIPATGATGIGYGTSYAAPIVSAAAAIVYGKHPDWTHHQVIRAILETARPNPELAGLCVTGGELDIEKALRWRP